MAKKTIIPPKIGIAATNVSTGLIATYGLKKALVISKLVHQKVKASHKRMIATHGRVDWS